jgi:rubrerythrin
VDTETRTAFLTELASTPAGRQHMLSLAVDAEEGDESGIFDQLADLVDDPKLRRIVERHRDDEVRHAGLFRGCLTRQGFEKQDLPERLRIIRRIAGSAGGGTGNDRSGVHSIADVVATYALLHAIELRGVEQFPIIAAAFRPFDPETAEVYLQVARDERGHVRYCQTIGRHYATDDAEWESMLAFTNELEASAFAGVCVDDITYCAGKGLVDDERFGVETAPGQPLGVRHSAATVGGHGGCG